VREFDRSVELRIKVRSQEPRFASARAKVFGHVLRSVHVTNVVVGQPADVVAPDRVVSQIAEWVVIVVREQDGTIWDSPKPRECRRPNEDPSPDEDHVWPVLTDLVDELAIQSAHRRAELESELRAPRQT